MNDTGHLTIDHVQLAIPKGSEDDAREFYLGVLGMEEVAKPPALASRGGFWARSGSSRLHFGIEDPFVPAQKAHPGFRVGNLDMLAARFVEHGIGVEWDDLLPGERRFYAWDPAGNRLEFMAERR